MTSVIHGLKYRILHPYYLSRKNCPVSEGPPPLRAGRPSWEIPPGNFSVWRVTGRLQTLLFPAKIPVSNALQIVQPGTRQQSLSIVFSAPRVTETGGIRRSSLSRIIRLRFSRLGCTPSGLTQFREVLFSFKPPSLHKTLLIYCESFIDSKSMFFGVCFLIGLG